MHGKLKHRESETLTLPALTLKEVDGVGIITLDHKAKKVNTLSSTLAPQFDEVFAYLEGKNTIKALVIISGKKDSFIAGADIEELQAAASSDEVRQLSQLGQEFFNKLEKLPIPVVAAIHGPCLGGGLELALACRYRIASDSPKTVLGLPEVMLGLLPGAGGTQRLPRLLGLAKALDLMLTGKQLKAKKALKMGLIDYVASSDGLEDIALAAAQRLAAGTLPLTRPQPKGPLAWAEKTSAGRQLILQQARRQVLAKSRGLYPAPLAILDVVGYGLDHGMSKGLAKESEQFARLSQTPESKGLISLYFATNDLKKNRFGEPEVKVSEIGVLGAGLMGAGIALVSLQKGFQVRLKDVSLDNLGKGRKYLWDALYDRVKRKNMSAFEAQQLMGRLYSQTDMHRFNSCGLIIEAVFEDLALKHKVLQECEEACAPGTVFASNTSALPISKIAAASKAPENIVGMHYFSPVHKMPLLEVITTSQTSERAAAIAVDVGLRQGKTVIVVKDGPGFYTTRILAPFMDEASLLALDGVGFHTLDETMQAFGYPVGPITLIDEVGLDVAYHVGKDLGAAFGPRIATTDPALLNAFMEAQALGRKAGKGFYLYGQKGSAALMAKLRGGKKKREVNPLAVKLIEQYATPAPRPVSREDMQKRMTYRMLNEAVYCLQEGILSRPLDGDIGAVFGLGFPPFLGGPFRYIDSRGAQEVVADLRRFEDDLGERFTPSPMLLDMAKSGKKFYP